MAEDITKAILRVGHLIRALVPRSASGVPGRETTPKCRNCQHWTEGAYRKVTGGLGQCNKVAQLWDATEWDERLADRDAWCDEDVISRVIKPGYRGQLMFTQDASDCSADLYTKGDFFCAHFEEKGGDQTTATQGSTP